MTCSFLKSRIFKGVSVEKIKLHAFSGVQYRFKEVNIRNDKFHVESTFKYLGDMVGHCVVLVQFLHVLFHCGKHSENCYLSLPTVQSEQNLHGNVCNMCVRKMLLYGSETWPVVTEDVQELVTPDSGMIRWIYGVSSKGHTPTADLLLCLGLVLSMRCCIGTD